MPEGEDLVDLELVNGIHFGSILRLQAPARHARVFFALDPARRPRYFEPGGSRLLPGTTPATRITLRTPAAKPSSRNTIMPHGDMPTARSSTHPIAVQPKTP